MTEFDDELEPYSEAFAYPADDDGPDIDALFEKAFGCAKVCAAIIVAGLVCALAMWWA